MTEKKRMLSGLSYKAWDRELSAGRKRAKILCGRMNSLSPRKRKRRDSLCRTLFGLWGEGSYIEPPFFCDYGSNISTGKNFYANHSCIILDCASVMIGDNVFLAPHVGLYTASHPLDHSLRDAGHEYSLPITIGSSVWIGGHSVVNPGVTIGAGTVIGSGSVVTRDIPAGVVAAGNPCRVIRDITDEDRKTYLEQRKPEL